MDCPHKIPFENCGECQMASVAAQRSYNLNANVRNEQIMRANQAASRWPQDVFERLEKERDIAVKMAATYRVALEKVQAALEARPDLSIEAFADTCLRIRRIVNDAGVGPDPSGSDE